MREIYLKGLYTLFIAFTIYLSLVREQIFSNRTIFSLRKKFPANVTCISNNKVHLNINFDYYYVQKCH